MQNIETTYEDKAEFLKRNVADFPGTLAPSDIGGPDAAAVFEGLGQYRELLLAMYSEPVAFRADNALDGYHNLTYTASFFPYAVMTAGNLCWEGANSYFLADKKEFKKQYRKPSMFPFQALENFGVYFVYKNRNHSETSFAKCDAFEMHFECGNHIALALSFLAGRLPAVNPREDYVLHAMDFVAMADYGAILSGNPLNRSMLSPLDGRLLRVAGERQGLWKKLIAELTGVRSLRPSCSMFPYLPAWIVRMAGRTGSAVILTLVSGRFAVEIGESADTLARLAWEKDSLPGAAGRLLESLGCIGCGRCGVPGKAIDTVNGVSICREEPYARRIVAEEKDEAEIDALMALVDRRTWS